MPTLQQFTDGHVLGARLSVDWSLQAENLPAAVGDAVQDLEARLTAPEFDATERAAIEPKSGSYPVAGSASMGLDGPNVGAILSLT